MLNMRQTSAVAGYLSSQKKLGSFGVTAEPNIAMCFLQDMAVDTS